MIFNKTLNVWGKPSLNNCACGKRPQINKLSKGRYQFHCLPCGKKSRGHKQLGTATHIWNTAPFSQFPDTLDIDVNNLFISASLPNLDTLIKLTQKTLDNVDWDDGCKANAAKYTIAWCNYINRKYYIMPEGEFQKAVITFSELLFAKARVLLTPFQADMIENQTRRHLGLNKQIMMSKLLKQCFYGIYEKALQELELSEPTRYILK